jgi:hypothetical protein
MPPRPKRHELQNQQYRMAHGLERPRRPKILLPERHLFVTEGTKTEPNYLNGLIELVCQKCGEGARRQLRVKGEGDNTLNLLEKAEKYQSNDADGFRHVWILYDKDDFPPDAFDNTAGRCEALNKRYREEQRELEFHAIWSNPCVELWFLLHYELMQSDIDRDDYRGKLSEKLGRHYDKSDPNIFRTLLPHMKTAVRNSKKLLRSSPESAPSAIVPGTNFHELVTHFQHYFK